MNFHLTVALNILLLDISSLLLDDNHACTYFHNC